MTNSKGIPKTFLYIPIFLFVLLSINSFPDCPRFGSNQTEYVHDLLAIPEQREHELGVSQLERRSLHTTGANFGGVFRIFETDQEITTSCDQAFE